MGVDADGARNRIFPRDIGKLLRIHHAHPHKLAGQGVVLRHLTHGAGAQHVDAAVPDVSHERVRAENQEHRDGRAHAALRGVGKAFGVHAIGGGVHRVLEQRENMLNATLVVRGAREGAFEEHGAVPREDFVDGAHRDCARDFSSGVATHAVGHDEQPKRVVDEKIVFVVFAFPADIGGRREHEIVRRWHACF